MEEVCKLRLEIDPMYYYGSKDIEQILYSSVKRKPKWHRQCYQHFTNLNKLVNCLYNIGLKTLLQQGISEPIFYGDLVYKFKRIVRKPNFSDLFKKIVKRYIRVGDVLGDDALIS